MAATVFRVAVVVLVLAGAASALLGGWNKMDLRSPLVDDLATVAGARLTTDANGVTVFHVDEVLTAESQIVNGVNYRLIVRFATSQPGSDKTGEELHRIVLHRALDGQISVTSDSVVQF